MKLFKSKIVFLVVLLLDCVVFLCACSGKDNNNPSSSEEVNQTPVLQLQIEKVTAPEEVINCLNEVGPMTIAYNLLHPESFNISEFSFDDIQIMEPFVVYSLQQDGTYNHNNGYSFPVMSKQNVLFILEVFFNIDEGKYNCSSTLNAERLAQFVGAGACNRMYIEYGKDFKSAEYKTVPVESDTRTIQTNTELTKQNINVLMNASDIVKIEYEKIPKNEGVESTTQS